jgi:O-antigen ligase
MISGIWLAVKMTAFISLAGMLFAWLLRPSEARWVRSRALPLTAGLFLTGMLVPNIWIMYLVIIAVIPMMSRSIGEAAACYMLVIIGLPRLEHAATIGPIYILPFDKWVMSAIGISIAHLVHRAKKTEVVGSRFDLPFLLFLGLELLQARGAPNFTSFLRSEVNALISFAIPYFAVTRAVRKPEDLRLMLLATCFGFFVLSIMAIYESRTGFLVYDFIAQRLGSTESTLGYLHVRSGMLRAHATFGDATALGSVIASVFLTMMVLRGTFRTRNCYFVALLVLLAGLYATNSRGPLVGLALGVICFDIYSRRYGRAFLKAGSLGGLYLLALTAAQFSARFADRLGNGSTSGDTITYRHLLITRGLEEIRKHPLAGISPNKISIVLADLRQGDGVIDIVNGYIYYALTAGVLGAVALLLCFLLPVSRIMKLRKRMSWDPQLLRIGALTFSLGIMTMLTCGTSGFGAIRRPRLAASDPVDVEVDGLAPLSGTPHLQPAAR